MIRKGQVRWLAKGDVLGQRSFIHRFLASLPETRQRAATPLPATSPLFATDPFATENDQEHAIESHAYLHQELHCLLNNHRVNAPVSLLLSQSQLVSARRNIRKVHREMQNDDGFFECCCDRTAKDRFPTYLGQHNLI